MEFKAHVFNTEIEAKNAIDSINSGEEIPRFPESETTTYCNYQMNEDYYFIVSDEVTRKYLTNEQTITINQEI